MTDIPAITRKRASNEQSGDSEEPICGIRGARDRQKILQIFDPHIEWIQNDGFPGGGRHIGADTVVNDVLKNLQKEWQGWQAVVEEWLDAG